MYKRQGFTSPEFALSLVFAAVVMYDAMGVRRAAGEQAKVLNKIVAMTSDNIREMFAPQKKSDIRNLFIRRKNKMCIRDSHQGKGPPFCRAVCPDAAGHRKVFAGAPAPAPDAAGLLPVQQRTAAEKAADCPVFAGGSQRSPVGAVCRGADDAGDLYCIKRILLKGNSKSAGDYRL